MSTSLREKEEQEQEMMLLNSDDAAKETLLPLQAVPAPPATGSKKTNNIAWVEGLRGLSAAHVVIHHLVTGWFKWTFWPAPGLDKPPHILQVPFIRVLWHGKIAVTMFALLTGYCCALKPMEYIRQNDVDGAMRSVRASAQKRIPRIMLSPIQAAFVAYIVVQLGLETASAHSSSPFHVNMTPKRLENFSDMAWQLYMVVWAPLSRRMPYMDNFQWPIWELLMLGFNTYLVILVVATFKFKYRCLCYALLMLKSYQDSNDQNIFMLQAVHGIFLADVTANKQLVESLRSRRLFNTIIPLITLTIALYFISFPYESPEWSSWSRAMLAFGATIFPKKLIAARFATTGTTLLFYSIFLSPMMQRPLRHNIATWLGKNSYAIYLLHGTLLRTVFIWIAVSFTGLPWVTVDEKGEKVNPTPFAPRSTFSLWMGVVVFLVSVLVASEVWTRYVESANERFTARISRKFSR